MKGYKEVLYHFTVSGREARLIADGLVEIKSVGEEEEQVCLDMIAVIKDLARRGGGCE